MSTYAIGDIQGCFASLQKLLLHISFDAQNDTLWFAGDVVNRGPDSLETLRFIKSLGDKHVMVLGNHDLHLLSLYYAKRAQNDVDTLQDILQADDAEELMAWLRTKPLMHVDDQLHYLMTHAGLPPCWTVDKAQALAREVESVLQSDQAMTIFSELYGNTPDMWYDDLTGIARWRCIINYFTRLRFCDAAGKMDFAYKGKVVDKPAHLMPWYHTPKRLNQDARIIFGHWAALEGKVDVTNVFALDTGCVWGGCLTAMRLEDGVKFEVRC